MKLHEIPNESKLMVEEVGVKGLQPATFHHTDGMYSYCTMNKDADKVFHLSVIQEMKKVGDHYEIKL